MDLVSFEDIVVAAWNHYPDRFSMRGYPQHPDASLFDKRISELKRDRLVSLTSERKYRLTDQGRRRALQIDAEITEDAIVATAARIERDAERLLRSVSNSDAYSKWLSGRSEEILDFDARAFFGVTATTNHHDRRERIGSLIAATEAAVGTNHQHAEQIRALVEYLLARFPELNPGPSDRPHKRGMANDEC